MVLLFYFCISLQIKKENLVVKWVKTKGKFVEKKKGEKETDTGNKTIVRKPDRSRTPDFFIIITSIQFLHLKGEKPSSSRILVREQSMKETYSSLEPAFMVENDIADGKQEIFSLAFFQYL